MVTSSLSDYIENGVAANFKNIAKRNEFVAIAIHIAILGTVAQPMCRCRVDGHPMVRWLTRFWEIKHVYRPCNNGKINTIDFSSRPNVRYRYGAIYRRSLRRFTTRPGGVQNKFRPEEDFSYRVARKKQTKTTRKRVKLVVSPLTCITPCSASIRSHANDGPNFFYHAITRY